MSKFDNDKVMPRYMMIAVLLTVIGLAVIGKALYIMTAKKQYWTEVADRLKRDSVSVKPNRGNILSCDGQLMATSIPEYKIFMDFQAAAFEKDDSLWLDKLDSVCNGLNKIFPSKSAEEFKHDLEEGRHKVNKNGSVGARHWPIWKRRIDYNTFVEVSQLPFFNMPRYKSGFHDEPFNSRRRPFGSLAMRTIGGLYGAKDSAYYGLELSNDSVLRGIPGITGRRKVLNKYMNIPVTLPEDGCDIVTTIDVNMQDLAERSLLDMLKRPEVNGELGVAILMEVETGDVKAIVNLMRNENGNYIEAVNSAMSYRCEPGSVFKTASILVALDDKVLGENPRDTSYIIHTGGGVMPMYGREMKDHNWRRGGYGDINVARTLEVSSNIGVSRIIDEHYAQNPEKFVKGIYRIGLASDLGIDLIQDLLLVNGNLLGSIVERTLHQVYIHFSVQMVQLMADGSGQKLCSFQFYGLHVLVKSPADDMVGSGDLSHFSGNGKAALHAALLSFGKDDLRVDQDMGLALIFCYINDNDPLEDAYLGRGQAYAAGFVHGLEHISDQGLHTVVHFLHCLAFLCQYGIAVLSDGSKCHVPP